MNKCDYCLYKDETTGCCSNEQQCIDFNLYERKQITPMEILKAFYVLLRTVGPVSMPVGLIDSISDEQQLIETTYDEEKNHWLFKPIVKRKRGILTPRKRLILPN